MVVNEFHTLNGQCATLIPQGPGYEGISLQNQVCTTVGSVPGQATVNGNRYVNLSFNYSYSHLWRVRAVSSSCFIESACADGGMGRCRISAS